MRSIALPPHRRPDTTWAAGDYAVVARHIADQPVRDALRAARVHAGARVLDVATGSGNVALAASAVGAQVTGLDLVPELLDVARAVRRAVRAAAPDNGR
jgi:ubiquinone/menaquinone biosynthesis C-methylase UbiE